MYRYREIPGHARGRGAGGLVKLDLALSPCVTTGGLGVAHGDWWLEIER